MKLPKEPRYQADFDFQCGDPVRIRMSGEEGVVIGRAEYSHSSPSYLVRYKAADGRCVEQWWSGDALIGNWDTASAA